MAGHRVDQQPGMLGCGGAGLLVRDPALQHPHRRPLAEVGLEHGLEAQPAAQARICSVTRLAVSSRHLPKVRQPAPCPDPPPRGRRPPVAPLWPV